MAATLTPFEVAQNRQWIFISGLLLMHVVDELITRGEECRRGAQDHRPQHNKALFVALFFAFSKPDVWDMVRSLALVI